jgi:hypothetical protein
MAKVTIAVLNYNYGRFVASAIESALAQTYPRVEVVVVDNGSTDDSLQVIAAYEGRVQVVRQPSNIGQGHGYNLAFGAARGDWILILDADDQLDADCIERCMALAAPDVVKVQFALRTIDADGNHLGTVVPFLRHDGDVTPIIRRFGHYAGPPGSGNLYRRRAIAPYFPVPTEQWPICTDTVPFLTAPFHGKVATADRPLGCYRLHKKATADAPGYVGNTSVSIATEVRLNYASRDQTLALLRERSGIVVAGPFLTLPTHVRYRIISWRWARSTHPFPEDSAARLWRLMCDSLRECPGYKPIDRLLMKLWAAGVLYTPGPLAAVLMSARRSGGFWEALIRWTHKQAA